MVRNRQVGWTTIYINGRAGAEKEILDNLKHSAFNFMPGYANEKGLILFWVDESESLRSFKQAIGAKTIFKYRLRFFTSVEAFVEFKHQTSDQDGLSPENDLEDNSYWPSLDSRDRLSA
jgi:hypothetical protein